MALETPPLRDSDLDSLRSRAESYLSAARRPVGYGELARQLFSKPRVDESVGRLLMRTLLGRDGRFRELPHGRWQLRADPDKRTPLSRASVAVVDIEATGSDPSSDEIIEIGIVRIEGMEIVSKYSSVVRPSGPIPTWIRRLTGIGQRDVESAPRFGEIAPRVRREIDADLFVAHNVDFDYPFLLGQLDAEGIAVANPAQLCTVRLARRLRPKLKSFRLSAVSRHFGVGLDRHHRAGEDAVAAAGILLPMLEELQAQQPDEELCVEDLSAFGVHPRLRNRLSQAAID